MVVTGKDKALLGCLRVVALLEAVSADIAVENIHVDLRRECLDLQGILNGIATAHARTVGVSGVARAHALDHDDGLFPLIALWCEKRIASSATGLELPLRHDAVVLPMQIFFRLALL